MDREKTLDCCYPPNHICIQTYNMPSSSSIFLLFLFALASHRFSWHVVFMIYYFSGSDPSCKTENSLKS